MALSVVKEWQVNRNPLHILSVTLLVFCYLEHLKMLGKMMIIPKKKIPRSLGFPRIRLWFYSHYVSSADYVEDTGTGYFLNLNGVN